MRLVNLPQQRALDLVINFLETARTATLGAHHSEVLLTVPECLENLNKLQRDLRAVRHLAELYELHLDLTTYRSDSRADVIAYYMLEEINDTEELERALERRVRAYLREQNISEQNFFEGAIHYLLSQMSVKNETMDNENARKVALHAQ